MEGRGRGGERKLLLVHFECQPITSEDLRCLWFHVNTKSFLPSGSVSRHSPKCSAFSCKLHSAWQNCEEYTHDCIHVIWITQGDSIFALAISLLHFFQLVVHYPFIRNMKCKTHSCARLTSLFLYLKCSCTCGATAKVLCRMCDSPCFYTMSACLSPAVEVVHWPR